MLREEFVAAFFHGLVEGTLGRGVTCLPVKRAVLALPDPTKRDPEFWKVSWVIKVNLVTALRGQ